MPGRLHAGADRQVDPAHSRRPAHPPSRVPPRRGQVRRHGGRRGADHAVLLREPVDGGAGGVGARQTRAGQRPMRRAQGPVPSQQRRPVLRELRGVCRDAVRHHVGPGLQRHARAQRPDVLPHALRVAGHRAEVPRDVRPARAGAARAPAGARAAARVLRAPTPHAAARPTTCWPRSRPEPCGHEPARRPPGAGHARLRRRHRPRGAGHPARAARRPATTRRSSSRRPTRASRT